MECKFSAIVYGVTLQNKELPRSEQFKILGSIISEDGEILDDVTVR